MKICKGCRIEKSFSEFGKNSLTKDGHEGKCKKCRLEQRKKHKIECKECGKIFNSAKKDAVYCNLECSSKGRRARVKTECSYCSKGIEVVKNVYLSTENNYCNNKCRANHLKTLMTGENNPNYRRVATCCSGCGRTIKVQPYKIENQRYVFCDYDCYKMNIGRFFEGENNPNYIDVKFECETCGDEFRRKPSANKGKRVFCSRDCYTVAVKNRPKKSIIDVKCDNCERAFKRSRSSLKGKKNIYCSYECSAEGNKKNYSGENSHKWNPNKSLEERLNERKYPEYYEWRRAVYDRDNYTCQVCSDDSGGNLVAHHIFNYSEHEALRIDVNNGITLCSDCHKEFHDTYGYTKNNDKQLNEFLLQHYADPVPSPLEISGRCRD